jgi:hypothetical protein
LTEEVVSRNMNDSGHYPLNRLIRAMDSNGEIKRLADGSDDQKVDDVYLRIEFPPPGKVKITSSGPTATDRDDQALAAFSTAIGTLEHSFELLSKVAGQPLVESLGVEKARLTDPWRATLKRIEEELGFWGRQYTKTMKVHAPQAPLAIGDEEDDEDGRN